MKDILKRKIEGDCDKILKKGKTKILIKNKRYAK